VKLPVNRFSAVLWIIAATYFVVYVGSYLMTLPVGQIEPRVLFGDVLRAVIAALVTASQPAAFGVLIELVDQIRKDRAVKL
jgi:Na+/H+-dicarboxylate symporter